MPKLKKVELPKLKKVELPKGNWKWNETNIDIISNEKDSKDILIKNIYYFFSKLNTKGLGEKIVEKLAGYILHLC